MTRDDIIRMMREACDALEQPEQEQATNAEEWLRSRYGSVRGHAEWRELIEAFNAGRASVHMHEQEPVATVEIVVPKLESIVIKHIPGAPFPTVGSLVYTHPPRREWQSLTDQEITDIFEAEPRYHYPPICATDREFARAIEAALKERNT